MAETAEELAIDFLTVSRLADPPTEALLAQALASAGLGAAEYTAAPLRNHTSGNAAGAAPPKRVRLGTWRLGPQQLLTTARLVVARHDGPVMDGMGETAFNAITRGLAAEDTHTLRTSDLALDLHLNAPLREALPALAWAMRLLRTLIDLTQGVVIDPGAQTCYGRAALARFAADDPLAHIVFHDEGWAADTRWLHTHGLQKFGRPELDLVAAPISLEAEGRMFLRDVAERLARGAQLAAGQEIVLEDVGAAVVAVGAPVDVDHQAPYGRLRLADAPQPGEHQGASAQQLLAHMALADATRRAQARDLLGSFEVIERVLAADPDACDALAMKARLHLNSGQALDAMQLGELMELRAPDDYRGPLTVGLALAAMRRYREALNALNRAIQRDPDADEVFAARATVHEGLGQQQLAAVDRAHAAYLRK
ncbi:MAG: hypothetical protein ABI068_10150 [Ktedonobacterales bacterium]